MDLAEQFVAFAEAGNQQKLATNDGRVWQGWIMEITDTALLMSAGEGEKGKDSWLNLQDINPNSLSYWDSKSQHWCTFNLVVE